ncbi:MAG: histidine acid phosphatase [Bifidobacterium sp.]|jgi:hypothetical protein|nr:histidine acid phosphatase [Bifidobacterium sp.]MCI1864915.1 histidine acid phosphatase [Bifidobacterium sp.]
MHITGHIMRGGVAWATSLLLVAASCGTANAAAQQQDYYSSKQPYAAPAGTSYSSAPSGYGPLYTESMARHGSRGLSSYKYDALLLKMAQTASQEGGFVSTAVQQEFMSSLSGIIAANVANGYGMLTGQGADQHIGIGARAFQRNAALFAQAAAGGGVIAFQTSGEPRATESGENFAKGFDAVSHGLLARRTATVSDPAGSGPAVIFDKTPDTLYFHEVDNPDGTTKTGVAAQTAQRYEDFVANDATIANAESYIENLPQIQQASDDVLSGIFTKDFISRIGGDANHTWYNTTDGKKHKAGENRYLNCAAGSDPAADPSACGEMKKSIATKVDAAMDLYNLYIIAADMTNENSGSHRFDFQRYFTGHEQDARWFSYVLDSQDFYEKGPGRAGQEETYSIAKPLLDDFFRSIDRRAAGGNVVATFRFAHAETMMPFAALLKLPGSTRQAPDVEDPKGPDDVFSYDNNPWRGSEVTPMAANVQWDVVSRSGVDPATGSAYTPLVRMLYNEREIAFNSSCTAVAAGFMWYKESELKRCLESVSTGESPRIAVADDSSAASSPAWIPERNVAGNASGALADTGIDIGDMAVVAVAALVASAVVGAGLARRRRRRGGRGR